MLNVNISTFSHYLGKRESDNNYSIKNPRSGALGKYQFMESTLNGLQQKYNLTPWVNDNNFLTDHGLQEIYFQAYTEDLLKDIESMGLESYVGTPLQSRNKEQAIINPYGLLAGGWLGGSNHLKDFLVNGNDRSDNPDNPAQGTFISDYITEFSNKTKNTNASTLMDWASFSSSFSWLLLIGLGVTLIYELIQDNT